MEHYVEVTVFVLDHPDDIEYETKSLEISFDLDSNNQYEIIGYYLDGSKVHIVDFFENNPMLTKRIERAIDHYVANFEEDFNEFDCE